jgi:hypothetical protein
MALNWVMLNPNRIPVPLPQEMTVTTIDSGVEISLTIPDVPPTGASNAGGSGGIKKLKAYGKLYLTDQRVRRTTRLLLIHIPKTDRRGDTFLLSFCGDAQHTLQFIFISDSPAFESLSVPLHALLSTRFEQPAFGANYLSFEIRPSPEGGLTDGTLVELRFRDRAMFEFVSLLEKARERAIYMKRQGAEDEEGLRQYHRSSTQVLCV